VERDFPREIRDMVYHFVVEYDDANLQSFLDSGVRIRHNWHTSASRVACVGTAWKFMQAPDKSDFVHLHDPYSGTTNMRLELAQAWWHTAEVGMENLEFLRHFDSFCPWKTGVSPKYLIRHIIVLIRVVSWPHRDYDTDFDPVFILAKGTRVTLDIQFNGWEHGGVELSCFFARIFPTLHRLKDAGFRIDATLPGMRDDTVGIIHGAVEFSPQGWDKYARAYIWAQKEVNHILKEEEARNRKNRLRAQLVKSESNEATSEQ
jgi:hypothetical protein